MRCGNCGKEIPDESKFCPKCGAKKHAFGRVFSIGSTGKNVVSDSIVALGGLVLLVLLGFVPMVDLNLYTCSGSYSVIDFPKLLPELLSDLDDYILIGSDVVLSVLVALILWFSALVRALLDIVSIACKEEAVPTYGAAPYLAFGIAALVAIFLAKESIALSPSGFLWLLTLFAIALTVFLAARKNRP